MREWRQYLLATAAFCAAHAPAYAESDILQDWAIDGYNTLRGDVYDIDGNKSASPFPNAGFHGYDEFGLNASRQYSPYERLNVNLQGVLTASDYRSINDGLVLERMQFLYENGESGVPYRLQAGDFYAGISYRTLQRTLKGASVELQPFSTQTQQHSVLLFSGTNQATYRNFDYDDDAYSGLSWLIEDRDWGRASFNLIHAYQDEATATLTGTDNSQWIYSAAFEVPFEFLSQNMTFESELAFFDGDYGTAAMNQSDTGVLAQLSGRSQGLPLDYRLRYERYGTDYRPNGAIVTPDRRSYEAHAGWRFDWGTYLRGRVQRFEDSFDSTNTQRTDLIGANLSGPFLNSLVTGLTGNIDVYQQQIDNAFNSISMDTNVLNASFNAPVADSWNGQLSFYVQDSDDQLPSNSDSTTKQLGAGVFFPVDIGELSGTFNLGLALRDVRLSGTESHEIHPTINMNLANESHRVNANYGVLNQNRVSGTNMDVMTQTAGVEYAYIMDNHEIGINGSYFDRNVNGSLDTDAWRAGLY